MQVKTKFQVRFNFLQTGEEKVVFVLVGESSDQKRKALVRALEKLFGKGTGFTWTQSGVLSAFVGKFPDTSRIDNIKVTINEVVGN